MLLDVESAKSAAYYARGLRNAMMNCDRGSLAKSFFSEAYFHCAAENIQIHEDRLTWTPGPHSSARKALNSFGRPAYHRELLAQRLGI